MAEQPHITFNKIQLHYRTEARAIHARLVCKKHPLSDKKRHRLIDQLLDKANKAGGLESAIGMTARQYAALRAQSGMRPRC